MARHLIAVDTTIRKTMPKDAPFRLNDGDGLYLLVKPAGARWWRFDYRIGGKRKTISLVVCSHTGLSAARAKAKDARRQVSAGAGLSDARKADKAPQAKDQETERRKPMQLWAAYLDSFKAGANVIPLHGHGAA